MSVTEAIENPDSTVSVESGICFHCGLPVLDSSNIPKLDVYGKSQQFCCHGCFVVCKTIVDAGLDDFYQFRTSRSFNAEADIVPDILKKLEVYDRAELQSSFVHSTKDWSEAALMLEDIRCPACLWLNERHLRQQAGVLEVSIDSTTQRMRVRWDTQKTQLSKILKAIADIGYIAHPYDAKHSDALTETRRTRSIERLIYAGILGMMVMNFSIAGYILGDDYAPTEMPLWLSIGRWTSLLVCLTLLAYPAQEFWLGTWRDLKNRRLGMDLPIVIGLSTAFFGSLHTILSGAGEVYFDSIAMFIFFVLLARYFEVSGKVKAAAYIDQLSKAVPQSAFRLSEDLTWQEIPVFDLLAGDTIRILPGEVVPADGIIEKGVSSFDESLLTGESMPITRKMGEAVIAGAVNGEQPVQITVTDVGSGTVLDHIRRMVDRGMEKKPKTALLAEKAARVFVPVILLIASMTAIFWYWLDPTTWLANTISVLIVTCPCALALATPVALAVTAGRFVKMGVLPLNMKALEALAEARVLALDKTGTLTTGRLSLMTSYPLGDTPLSSALQLAASLSQHSEHPVAKAIGDAWDGQCYALKEPENVPGGGIAAFVEGGEQWWLGRQQYIEQQINIAEQTKARIADLQKQGLSLSLLANQHGVQAAFTFIDKPREQASDMIAGLREQGIAQVAILSGDTEESVSKLAHKLAISDAMSGLSPKQKLDWVLACQQQGEKVIMFGDGINDAPTLAAADASVSITGATDLAHVSSDFLLLKKDISVLADARRLAMRSRANIKQNMYWAFTYNLAAVPLAVMGYVPPWLAAIGMSVSSLVVVLNALRLKKD